MQYVYVTDSKEDNKNKGSKDSNQRDEEKKQAPENSNEKSNDNNPSNPSIQNKSKEDQSGTISLRQEQLDITKNKVQTGEVILSKEVVEEKMEVDVPVTHEEVVIERRPINNKPCDSPITSGETIRIPVSEEKVQVGKHTVITEEISAYKREIKETERIQETLKREEAHVNQSGNLNVVSYESKDSLQ